MSATIGALLEVGFVPIAVATWAKSADSRISWRLVDGYDPAALLDAVASAALRKVWLQASTHVHGKNLEEGGDLTAARRLLDAYEKSGAYGEYQHLLQAVCTGLWPRARKHECTLLFAPDVASTPRR